MLSSFDQKLHGLGKIPRGHSAKTNTSVSKADDTGAIPVVSIP